MKILLKQIGLLALLCCLSTLALAQTPIPTHPDQKPETEEQLPEVLEPLTEAQLRALYETPADKRVPWTEPQKQELMELLDGFLADKAEGLDKNCVYKEISSVINYRDFTYNALYQQGRIVEIFGKEACPK